jgi:hypothetical protein
MTDLLVQKAALEARHAELTQRIAAIQQDYAAGLSADSEERAQQLENAEVLAEISRVANEDLAKVTKKLADIAGLLQR